MPVDALPPTTPFTCQLTAVFDVPETDALKDCVVLTRTFAVAGVTATLTPDPEGLEFPGFELELDEFLTVPEHPAITAAARIKTRGQESPECERGPHLHKNGEQVGGAPPIGLSVKNYARV